MRIMTFSRTLPALLFPLLVAAADRPAVLLNSAGIKAVLTDGATAVVLPFVNAGAAPARVHAKLEWLNPAGAVTSAREYAGDVANGSSDVTIPFGLPPLSGVWVRLRYQIRSDGLDESGTLGLFQIADYVFELNVIYGYSVGPGNAYRFLVSAVHPVTGRPVAGVAIHAGFDTTAKSVEGTTDARGLVALELPAPPGGPEDEAVLTIEGSLGGFTQKAEPNVSFYRWAKVDITPDKPIYQPGQMLHVRLVCFAPSGPAAASLPIKLEIKDPEDTAVFSASLVTNRFGVTASEWQIPDNVRLGDYEIAVTGESGDKTINVRSSLPVRISRYDLPEFAVTAKPDRAYYLPGQDASIEVQADYLFGKPVPRGHVRVVEETERTWNYKLQKWDIAEGEEQEGNADASGHFRAKVSLTDAHEDLADNEDSRFKDLHFAASVRDPSTGRTEERRFDVRVTRDSIHIYPINSFTLRGGSPGPYYISTSYADGTPAVCRVKVNGAIEVTTNRYGVARIDRFSFEPDSDVLVVADDGHGRTGRWKEHIYGVRYPREDWFSIRTDKTLYHPGEPIRAKVETNQPDSPLALAAFREGRLLSLEWLTFADGKAAVDLPWRPEYLGEIVLSVATADDMVFSASKSVLFPHDTSLRVGVQPAQGSYRPGEEATATVSVVSPGGRAAESAFGVAVVDAAVGERARADAGSGRAWQTWGDLLDESSASQGLGGVKFDDLTRLDPGKPFPEGLDLVAEAFLCDPSPAVMVESTGTYSGGPEKQFHRFFEAQFAGIEKVLDAAYRRDYTFPRSTSELQRVLGSAGIDIAALRDPWGKPYRIEFDSQGANDLILVFAAGSAPAPEPLFVVRAIQREHAQPLHDALERLFAKLSAYPSSETEARARVAAAGIDVDHAIDSWGTAYRFSFRIQRDNAVVSFLSAGPDRKFGTGDDFTTGRVEGPYFKDSNAKLSALLATSKQFPKNDAEWTAVVRSAGLFPLKDPWGRPLYAVFDNRFARTNLVKFYASAQYGSKPKVRKSLVPATSQISLISLRSAGPDGLVGTADDFTLAEFSSTLSLQTADKETNRVLSGTEAGKGAIGGVIRDASGAVIPNAKVSAILTAKDGSPALQFDTVTNTDGVYSFAALPAGTYEVHMTAPGFMSNLTMGLTVNAGETATVNAVLQVKGSNMEVTVVSASAVVTQTKSATLAAPSSPRATPRLREYFPETLLWEPLLETGPDGRARIRFKLADNITTWKLSVMASTVEGETGTATADIRAFQPFFVDHNPPRILTQGDQIQLPVTIRNYLDRAQAVDATIKPESWFALEGPHERQFRIAAGASANAIFPMRAISAVTDGKQRITATSAEAGDAIEKPVTVHPDGNQLAATVNDVFGEASSLKLTVPAGVIPDSTRAELRIYPNLISHLVESIEAILERPYGCGEQTISSTYPSLLLLKYLRRAGHDDHPLAPKARRYLQQGFDRLRGYEAPGGGFTYWGRGEADLSLTAYALTFLNDAGEFVTVPDELLDRTERFLRKSQRPDGSWLALSWDKHEDPGRTAQQTALIALALSGLDEAPALEPALGYLSKRVSQMDEPYLVAAFALAAERADEQEMAQQALAILRRLARSERGLSYWNLEANTPFYGWGTAGRLETTALALRAFQIARQPQDHDLASHALLFLLGNKDRYGVWYSTQATIRVLDAILEAATAALGTGEPGPAEIRVNDRPVETVSLPGPMEIAPPVRIDLSRELRAGENVVSLHRAHAGTPAQAQLVATWYVPWPHKPEAQEGALRLTVAFDKTAVAQNDVVTCQVAVERVGFRGYGMLLGEIGLPPGADVDRQSLERALTESSYALTRYDILPDRVVVYLWPRAGETKFSFNFRPRFAMRAMTAPSSLYDYYNPDARTAVPPVSFDVR